MKYVLDSNIVIYAFDKTDPPKHEIALRIFELANTAEMLTIRQILGEVLNAAHKKRHLSVPDARAAVAALEVAVPVLATDERDILAASEMAERYKLQYFDALICTVAQRHGASFLVSEDMHDGLRLGGLVIVDPFKPTNQAIVEMLLAN